MKAGTARDTTMTYEHIFVVTIEGSTAEFDTDELTDIDYTITKFGVKVSYTDPEEEVRGQSFFPHQNIDQFHAEYE